MNKVMRGSTMLPRCLLVNGKSNSYEVEAPLCVLHTRTGCIPHLTNETFVDSSAYSNFFQIPLPSVINFTDAIGEGGGACECFALPPKSITFLSLHDFSKPLVHGYNTKDSVAIWRLAGKVSVTSKMYMKAVESLQPDVYQILADSDVTITDSRKRSLKSMNRSLQFLEDCLNFHKKSEVLQHSGFLCTLVGGYLVEERKQFVRLALDKLKELEMEPAGYVIDLSIEESLNEETQTLIEAVVEMLPRNKPKFLHGFGHPLSIITLLKCGISAFDTAHITRLAESNRALIFKIPNSTKPISKNAHAFPDSATGFVETICLSESCFADQFVPLLENCTCYTCTHHTRAYLHHLVSLNEMLAPTLLMMHNLHHNSMFFKYLREADQPIDLLCKDLIAHNFVSSDHPHV